MDRILTHTRPAPLNARRTAAGVVAALGLTVATALPAAAEDERHRVASGDTVSGLAIAYRSTVNAIVDANALDSRATIYVGQTLTIPSRGGAAAAPARTTSHTVRSGDTVWDLARRYGTTVSAIISANSLNSTATIRIGQTLTVPTSGAAATPTAPSSSASTASHTVRSGDTVWDLARRYGTSVSSIVSANSLSSTATIRIGQTLSIPGAVSAGESVASGSDATLATPENITSFGTSTQTHTVTSGQTLSSIASRYSVPVATIVSANGIKNPSMIRVGQRLTIPGAAASGLVGDTFAGRTYATDVVASANQNKATLLATSVPSRAQMQSMIVSTASSMGVDTSLAQAIAYQESGFNMRAVSPANAIGAMQVIPTSGEWASDLVGRDLNLLNAQDNVTAGVAIMRQLVRTSDSLETAIAGYYQGAASVRSNGMFADTKRYVASVLALMEQFD